MRELDWEFDPNHILAATGAAAITTTRAHLMYVKNQLVALGGWEVIGSSRSSGSVWEYEGVTGGGVYGGSSTGPYDVWEDVAALNRAADGSSPAFAVLCGPTWNGVTPYLIIGFEGTSDAQAYIAACDEKPELVGGAVAYLPNGPEGSEFVERARQEWYLNTNQQRSQFCVSPTNGSFFLVTNNASLTYFTGFVGFWRTDPRWGPPNFSVGGGKAAYNELYYYYLYWDFPTAPDQPWNMSTPGAVDGNVQWAEPYRGSTRIMTTDLNTVNCFGNVEPFPLYFVSQWQVDNVEYKSSLVARFPDMWASPQGLLDGDTMSVGGSIAYMTVSYWLVPANTTPLMGDV